MFPLVSLPLSVWGGRDLLISTSLVLDFVCVAIGLGALLWALHGRVALWRSFALVGFVTAAAWIGARLFHVLWERPDYYRAHPLEIFTNFEGMTFYGAFGGGLIALFLGVQVLLPRVERARIWDLGAFLTALFYGILRIGCFADGCCWGRLCAYPWAVRYFNPDSEMPYLGVPVHPVQLYDSFAGFAIAALLWDLHRRVPRLRGWLMVVFMVAYPAARFATERYRGDAYRGVHLFLGLSTGQLVSVALIAVALPLLVWRLTSARNLSYREEKAYAV